MYWNYWIEEHFPDPAYLKCQLGWTDMHCVSLHTSVSCGNAGVQVGREWNCSSTTPLLKTTGGIGIQPKLHSSSLWPAVGLNLESLAQEKVYYNTAPSLNLPSVFKNPSLKRTLCKLLISFLNVVNFITLKS